VTAKRNLDGSCVHLTRSPSVSGGNSNVAFELRYRSISSSREVPGELVSVLAQNPKPDERKRSRAEELEHGKREIGLEEYCSVLQF
jgi:hypothetical protein